MRPHRAVAVGQGLIGSGEPQSRMLGVVQGRADAVGGANAVGVVAFRRVGIGSAGREILLAQGQIVADTTGGQHHAFGGANGNGFPFAFNHCANHFAVFNNQRVQRRFKPYRHLVFQQAVIQAADQGVAHHQPRAALEAQTAFEIGQHHF